MRIVLKKTSLVDYPGQLSAVFFFTGCNLRCPWCQNRELVSGEETTGLVDIEKGIAQLVKRRSVLGGVVLSGGEPMIHQELPDIVKKIKALGLPVKLDTNGMNPEMLHLLLEHEETRPDYIALDLKIAPDRYGELAPFDKSKADDYGERLVQSAALIRSSGIAHEYRTLALPQGAFTETDIEALAALVDGSSLWYWRLFMPGNCLDPRWDSFEKPRPETLQNLTQSARKLGKNAINTYSLKEY